MIFPSFVCWLVRPDTIGCRIPFLFLTLIQFMCYLFGRSFDELESQEMSCLEEWVQKVLPEASTPIGVMAGAAEDPKQKQIDELMLLAPAAQTPFWQAHRDTYERLQQRRKEPSFNYAAAASMSSPSVMSHGMSTAASPSAMDVSRNSISSFSLTSPTGRMG